MAVRIRVSTPLTPGGYAVELGLIPARRITGGSLTTLLPGGYGVAQIQLAARMHHPVPPNAHLEVVTDHGFWEGRILRPSDRGIDTTSIEAHGYGVLDDDFFENTDGLTKYDSTECLRAAVASAAPLLHTGPRFEATGILHTLNLFDGRTAPQVADQLTTESGWDYAVWRGREANFYQRVPPEDRVEPENPDYDVFERDCAEWTPDFGAIWTSVEVTWTDFATNQPGEPQTWTDLEAESILGIHRRTKIDAGTTDLAGALAFAQTFVALHKDPPVRATIGPASAIRGWGGTAVHADAVVAGQWVRVRGKGVLVIVDTNYDLSRGQVTCSLGLPRLDAAATQSALTRFALAVKAGTNPNSAAKA